MGDGPARISSYAARERRATPQGRRERDGARARAFDLRARAQLLLLLIDGACGQTHARARPASLLNTAPPLPQHPQLCQARRPRTAQDDAQEQGGGARQHPRRLDGPRRVGAAGALIGMRSLMSRQSGPRRGLFCWLTELSSSQTCSPHPFLWAVVFLSRRNRTAACPPLSHAATPTQPYPTTSLFLSLPCMHKKNSCRASRASGTRRLSASTPTATATWRSPAPRAPTRWRCT